ncbi:zinc-dependent metalloprotease family protein [Pseudomonas abietaniphila]|uniref:zinc-dependent metalloprotease family protein n=1 Tax=Pseudomonas abietaniphila TaxID=89065 RepID=UPI0032164F98
MDSHIARTAPYSQWLIIRLLALLISAISSSIFAAAPPASNLIELEQVIDRAAPQSSSSDYLKRLLDDPANQELRWVTANPAVITEAAQNISFAVSEQKTKTFHLRSFKNSIDGMVVWIGDTPSDRKTRFPGSNEVDFDPFNNAIIVRDGDKLSGTFMVDGQPYKLAFIEDGRHALIKIDETKLAPEGEPLPGQEESADVSITPAADLSIRHIRVLMVTTRQSRASRPTIRADIVNAIEAANLATYNSGVLIQFQLAGIYDAAYDEEGDSNVLLSNLRNVQTDLGKAVADNRNLYLADLVSMVMTSPEVCGRAYLNATKASAYSVISCTSSLAHEMGHNLGADHNREGFSGMDSPPYMFGYRHEAEPKFRTKMSAQCRTGSCPRIAFFSTPYRSYEGIPMGTVEHNNVARRLNERRGVVDDFYPGNHKGYKPFLNRFMLDAHLSLCLQTNSADSSVAMGPCSAAGTDADQNSMREWKAVSSDGTYWNIRNHFIDSRSTEDQCLMTTRKLDAVGKVMMGACSPAAGEYVSQRQWTLESVGNGLYELKNKYSHDAHNGECLRTFAENKTVLLDNCRPNGKADYNSMRRWNWEMFQ